LEKLKKTNGDANDIQSRDSHNGCNDNNNDNNNDSNYDQYIDGNMTNIHIKDDKRALNNKVDSSKLYPIGSSGIYIGIGKEHSSETLYNEKPSASLSFTFTSSPMEYSEENSKEISMKPSKFSGESSHTYSGELSSASDPQEPSDSKIINRFLRGLEESFLINLKGIIFVKEKEKKDVNDISDYSTESSNDPLKTSIHSLSSRNVPVLVVTAGASKQQAAG
jgi:hypothetical protein